MTRNKKIIIILFVIAILLTGIWLSLDSRTKNSLYWATLCKLIYGKNICNFYAMMDTRNPSISDFDNMMSFCRGMSDVPKKDSCFEYIAEVFSRIDVEKAQQACKEIKEFNGVHSKESCHSKISKIQEINESKKKAIKIYLEENIWKPYNEGKVFCAYEVLCERVASFDTLIPEGVYPAINEYLWVLCEEYYLENGKLQKGGGTSLPVVLTLQRENHIYEVISSEIPKTDSYKDDIERIFPEDIRRDKMFSNDVNYHNQHIKILENEIKKEAEENKASEIIFPEVIWDKYVNHNLGFSMKIPQKVQTSYKCPSREKIQAPVKVFEDNENGVVYISKEYHYEAEWDSELREYIGPCEKITYEKITYSLELFRSENEEDYPYTPFSGWTILIRSIKDEGELDKFIKEIYGPGCSAGDKQPWEQQNGVYEISVSVGGTHLGNTTCPLGWTTREKVLYAPEKNKFVFIILGPDCTFYNNPYLIPHYQCCDEEMISSFKFE